MGHQIYLDDGTREEGLFFTRGANLVRDWCELFTPRSKPDEMSDYEWCESISGSTVISVESIKKANESIPTTYEEYLFFDQRIGLFDTVDKSTFDQCREFLRLAAERKVSISGSW